MITDWHLLPPRCAVCERRTYSGSFHAYRRYFCSSPCLVRYQEEPEHAQKPYQTPEEEWRTKVEQVSDFWRDVGLSDRAVRYVTACGYEDLHELSAAFDYGSNSFPPVPGVGRMVHLEILAFLKTGRVMKGSELKDFASSRKEELAEVRLFCRRSVEA